jgi:alpha-beta hydrolase superfamily lysophospholipase
MSKAPSGRSGRPLSLWVPCTALALLGLTIAAGCGGSDSAPSQIPAEEVRTAEVVFVDPSRPTPPNNGVPGSPDRTLATRVWLAPRPLDAPACRGARCALVLLAHGFGGNTGRFDTVARGLARAGYVVAAPAFPLTNDRAPGGHATGLADAIEQPADLSFVIDQLIELSEGDGDLLSGRIDVERIGVVGHSLGGATVLGLTRRPCCRDARVGATALVAPFMPVVEAFFGGYPTPEGPPILVVNGSLDPVVTPDVARELYRRTARPHALLVLNGASHADLLEDFGTPELLGPTTRTLLAHFDRSLGNADGALEETLSSLGEAGHEVASEL